MTLREIIRKPFWTPKDISIITGVSITKSREIFLEVRDDLASRGYIFPSRSRLPGTVLIHRLKIDIVFLENQGGLDVDLDLMY